GRPDLRESGGGQEALREELAKNMYSSLREKLMKLADDVVLYPGHGAGTLCGKALSEANTSTIGAEKITNWSLQEMPREQFVKELIADQPFIPAYFPFNVDLNKKGAPGFTESVNKVAFGEPVKDKTGADRLESNRWIVDTRDEKKYKKGHLEHSVNIMDGNKFETWLGSIIKPGEPFYLAGENEAQLKRLVERAASIGYEPQILEAFVLDYAEETIEQLDLEKFKADPNAFTIVDVRNPSEVKQNKIFSGSLTIPLAEIRERMNEIPTNKPIAVHCAGGYRSAAASSLIASGIDGETKVFDIGEAIKDFQ
ncbi:MAG TPA: rhodanese-like domain-containing protein, partial [Sphingobacteriaceae bacterium]